MLCVAWRFIIIEKWHCRLIYFFMGVPLTFHYVQRQLGHSSIAITVDIYGHWIPGEGRAGLEAALAGGAGKGSGEGKIVPFSVP